MTGIADTVSLAQVATEMELSKQTILNLANGGYITKVAKGRYVLIDCFKGYIRYLKDEERRTTKSAAGSRVQDRRADEIELRIEERSRALVGEAVSEAVAIVTEYAGPLKSDVLSIVPRLTSDIPLRRKFESAIHDAFGEAAKRASASVASAQGAGADLDQGSGPTARRVGKGKPRLSGKRRSARSS